MRVAPSYADPSRDVYRPIIPLVVYGLAGKVALKGLADTGALDTILPEFLMGETGAALRHGETGVLIGADGHPFIVTYGTVDLEIRMKRRRIRRSAKVAFHPTRQDAILGDAGFLRYFTVTFNGPGRYLTLAPSGRFPRAIMPAR